MTIIQAQPTPIHSGAEMNSDGNMMKFGVGQPLRRFEDQRLLTGKRRFQAQSRVVPAAVRSELIYASRVMPAIRLARRGGARSRATPWKAASLRRAEPMRQTLPRFRAELFVGLPRPAVFHR